MAGFDFLVSPVILKIGAVFAAAWIVILAYGAVTSFIYRHMGHDSELPGWSTWECTHCGGQRWDYLSPSVHCCECGEVNWGYAEKIGTVPYIR